MQVKKNKILEICITFVDSSCGKVFLNVYKGIKQSRQHFPLCGTS